MPDDFSEFEDLRRAQIRIARKFVSTDEAEDVAIEAIAIYYDRCHQQQIEKPSAYLASITANLAKGRASERSREERGLEAYREHMRSQQEADHQAARDGPVEAQLFLAPGSPSRDRGHGQIEWTYLFAYTRRRARALGFAVEGGAEDLSEFCTAANAAWLFTERRRKQRLTELQVLLTHRAGKFRGKLLFVEMPLAYQVTKPSQVVGDEGYIHVGPPHRWNGPGKPPSPPELSPAELAMKFSFKGGAAAVERLLGRFDKFVAAFANLPRREGRDEMWKGGLPRTLTPR